MTPILSKPYYRSELDLLPTKSTNPETTNWRCLMASEGNGFTHYLVSKGVVLGEACIIEQCNEWISLAFIKLGIDRPEAVIPAPSLRTTPSFRKRQTNPSDSHPQAVKPTRAGHLLPPLHRGAACLPRLGAAHPPQKRNKWNKWNFHL